MHYLPSYPSKPRNALEHFIHDNEPAGRAEAKAFRQGLIAALNYASKPLCSWAEHPDSMYLEEDASDLANDRDEQRA